jgi:AGCS family alanine or glycine:cation symporter
MFQSFTDAMYALSTKALAIPFIIILLASLFLTLRSGFIQFRALPVMIRMLISSIRSQKSSHHHDDGTIPAYKALFISMSTTIGIGNMVGPILAIGMGGPGAMIGFVLATIFGAAATFTEVSLAIRYRKILQNGIIAGGPMGYLKKGCHTLLASWYAYSGVILLIAWSSNQSNTLGLIVEPYGIPRDITGALLAILVAVILAGGIKRIGNLNDKLVPLMFLLYTGSASFIIFKEAHAIPHAFSLIYQSITLPDFIWNGATGVGLYHAMRYGLAKAFQSNEAGVGTATFAHSMAHTSHPTKQAILAMLSVYTNGFLCCLSGLMILVCQPWEQITATGIPPTFDISMLALVIQNHFPLVGPAILISSSFLFAFGTILGNGFNGSQCYSYISKGRGLFFFYVLTALVVFLGAISDVKFVWIAVDFLILPVALINIFCVSYLSIKEKDLFNLAEITTTEKS